MKFLGLKKLQQGRFVTRYDLRYQTASGKEKVYEMISRQNDIKSQRQLWDHPTDAVIMLLTDAADQHVLLLKEFRMAAGEAVYNIPAGLVEPGESIIETAEGVFRESSSEEEEIECGWYDRSQVRRLLATAPFESRTQLYCHLWAKGGLK